MRHEAYAPKLFLQLIEGVDPSQQEADLRLLRSMDQAFRSPDLHRLRMHWALLSSAQRMDVLGRALSSVGSEQVQIIVTEVLAQDGFDGLQRFLAQYTRYREQHHLGVEASISSATPLSTEQKERIKHSLSKGVGQPVVLYETLDPSLQGGFRLRVKDWVYDASLHGRLQQLFQPLIA